MSKPFGSSPRGGYEEHSVRLESATCTTSMVTNVRLKGAGHCLHDMELDFITTAMRELCKVRDQVTFYVGVSSRSLNKSFCHSRTRSIHELRLPPLQATAPILFYYSFVLRYVGNGVDMITRHS